MKITGYKIRNYVFEMGRPLGDANSPAGSGTWMSGSILYLDTNEKITGVSLGGNTAARETFVRFAGGLREFSRSSSASIISNERSQAEENNACNFHAVRPGDVRRVGGGGRDGPG